MTFLLTLAVVLSFICQTDPQIFAQSPDVTDDEAEVAVQSDETALPEDEQTAEEGPRKKKRRKKLQCQRRRRCRTQMRTSIRGW